MKMSSFMRLATEPKYLIIKKIKELLREKYRANRNSVGPANYEAIQSNIAKSLGSGILRNFFGKEIKFDVDRI